VATARVSLDGWRLSRSTVDRVHVEQGLHADRALRETRAREILQWQFAVPVIEKL
jgi:hypothetical protein